MPIRFDPLRELDRLAQSFGQLLNRPGPVRVDRTDEEIRLDVDLPGVRADDIDLTLEGDRVVVRAVRRSRPPAAAPNGGGPAEVHHEYRIGEPVDVDAVRADYEDGVLRVHLPRPGGSRVRRIPVGAGSGPASTGSAGAPDPLGGASEPVAPPPGEQANPLPTS